MTGAFGSGVDLQPAGSGAVLRSLLDAVSEDGRIERTRIPALHPAAGIDGSVDPLRIALEIEKWLGPFEQLSLPAQRAIEEAILLRERDANLGFELGGPYTALLRFLWRLKGPHWNYAPWGDKKAGLPHELLGVLALAARRAPADLWAFSRHMVRKLRGRWSARPHVADVLARLGIDPLDLAICYARGIPQAPGYRGYWHDPERNVTVARLAGIDLQPSDDGHYLIENNSNAGTDMRRCAPFPDRDPFAENLFRFAAEKGYRHVLLSANNADGVNPLLEGHLVRQAERSGIRLTIQNLHNVADGRHPRGWKLPENLESDTLVLRVRRQFTALDHLFGHKPATYRALALYKAISGDPDLRLPAFGPDPVLADIAPEEPFPNLVYKLPDLTQQRGVVFFKARDAQHARSLVREGLRRRKGDTLLDRIEQMSDHRQGVFQSYVRPRLLPGRRAFKIRALVLVSPVGHRVLAAHTHDSRVPVPDRLSEGIVRDPRPFLVGLQRWSRVRPLYDEDFGAFEAAALAVARGLAWAAEYGFRTRSEEKVPPASPVPVGGRE